MFSFAQRPTRQTIARPIPSEAAIHSLHPLPPEPPVPDTQEIIREALANLRPAGLDVPLADCLIWAAESDGFVSLKLCTPTLDAPEPRAEAAHAARDAIGLTLAEVGSVPLRSLIVEFVDNAGRVLQTERLGPGASDTPDPTLRRASASASTEHKNPPHKTPPQDADAEQREASDQAPACATSTPQTQPTGHQPIGGLSDPNPLDTIKHIIAVGAGKGGVGKSTIAVNLAVGLAKKGHAVGLLDGDIYGPSLPTMLGLDALEQNVVAGKLQPHAVHGIKAITIGKLVDPDKPLIWRGPMAHGAFKQLIEQSDWGELDYLIIDLPPGTGDVCLTLAQTLQCTGAVIVCTPQKVAQDDAVRAANMFTSLKIDVLGVIENMSYFIGDPDEKGKTKEYDIFGRGGAEMMAQRIGLPFLGCVPINMALRTNSDTGEPLKNFTPETAGGEALPAAIDKLITTLEGQIALASIKQGKNKPTLSIS